MADWKIHALVTQFTTGTVTVADAVAEPPDPVATSWKVVVAVTGYWAVPLSATAWPLIVAALALVVCHDTLAVLLGPSVAVMTAVGGGAASDSEASADAGPSWFSALRPDDEVVGGAGRQRYLTAETLPTSRFVVYTPGAVP